MKKYLILHPIDNEMNYECDHDHKYVVVAYVFAEDLSKVYPLVQNFDEKYAEFKVRSTSPGDIIVENDTTTPKYYMIKGVGHEELSDELFYYMLDAAAKVDHQQLLDLLKLAITHWTDTIEQGITHLKNTGICSFIENAYFNPILRPKAIYGISAAQCTSYLMRAFVKPLATDRDHYTQQDGTIHYPSYYYPLNETGHIQRLNLLKRVFAHYMLNPF